MKTALKGGFGLACLCLLLLLLSWQPPGAAITRGKPLALISPPVLAGRYLDFAQRELPGCYSRLAGPRSQLAKAIISVEAASAGALESLFERPVFRLASAVLPTPPDWSVGPAQLRYSTLGRLRETKRARLEALTEDCANMASALALVRILHREAEGSAAERRVAVIRAYNGQRTSNLSNGVYVSVVLAVHDALESRSPSTKLAAVDVSR